MTSLLPIPEQVFVDNNGVPLAGGSVATFIPSTTTPKTTWQDSGQVAANTQPITLDSGGKATIYGSGDYRLVVKDSSGNLVMDGPSAAYELDSAISPAMAPVVAASTLATARALLGVDSEISAAVSAIELMPGPQGVPGGVGPVGPQGVPGSSGTESYNRQVFAGSGTWTKPVSGAFAIIQLWGAGGAGTVLDDGSGIGPGGGGGGYSAIMCLTTDLASSVSVTIGSGGLFSGSIVPGASGGTTSFGSYLVQAGGQGGNVISGGAGPQNQTGAQGYLLSASGLTLLFGSTDAGLIIPTVFYTGGQQSSVDNLGNKYASAPFSGTPGGPNLTGLPINAFPSIFGGTGGATGANGTAPGGGGGWLGGSGAAGQVIVTVF